MWSHCTMVPVDRVEVLINMATNRRPVKHHRRAPSEIPLGVWTWLVDEPFGRETQGQGRLQIYICDRADLWFAHRDRALAYWTAKYPGTRPKNWWLFESPEPLRPGESQPD